MQQGVQVHRSIIRPPVLPANLNRQGAMMDDWAYEKVKDIWHEYLEYGHTDEWLVGAFIAALRDAAAEGRRNAIEKSAELIGRQVEARDA